MKLVSRNQNIFHKVALQSMRKNPTRTLVTIIGVILSAALFTAVTTFGISLLQYMIKGAVQRYGDWQIAFPNANAAFIQQQAQNPKVTHAVSFAELGYAELDITGKPDKPYLFLAGFNDETFAALPLTLLSGRLPENDQELVIPGKLLTEGGATIAVGDTIPLTLQTESFPLLGPKPQTETGSAQPNTTRTYTIVGLCATPEFLPDAMSGYLGITQAAPYTEAQTVSLFVTLENLLDVRAYRKQYIGQQAYWLNNNVLRFLLLSDSPSDTIFITMLLSFGAIVMILIMVGSILLIYNAFHISLNERTQQIGILASVGATRTQLRNSVLFEGWCIGAVGIPIGVFIGLLGIELIIKLVATQFSSILYADVPLTTVISPLAIGGAIGISLITILLSAYIPAQKAASASVIACIRQTNEIKLEGRNVKTSRLLFRLFGLEGALAQKNFKRNRKRYRSVVFSLVFSVVLFLSASTLITDLQQNADGLTEFTTHDISFSAEEMTDTELLSLYEEMKAVPGVTGSLYQIVRQARCLVSGRDLVEDYWIETQTQPTDQPVALSASVQFVDTATYQRLCAEAGLSLPSSDGSSLSSPSHLLTVAKLQRRSTDPQGEMQVSEFRDLFAVPSAAVTLVPIQNDTPHTEQAQSFCLDTTEVVLPDQPPQLQANGTALPTDATTDATTAAASPSSPVAPYYLQIVVPYTAQAAVLPTAAVQAKGMEFQSDAPSQSAAAMERILREKQVSTAYLLINISKILEQTRNTIFIAEIFAYTFLVMISLIAVANVFNTISTNMRLRRREIAMLRSVGMSDRSLNQMTRLECFFYGGKALLIGLPLALLTSWQIHHFMVNDEDPFVLPLPSMLISVVSVLLIVFVTMTYAVRKIQKENIMDALRDDMT